MWRASLCLAGCLLVAGCAGPSALTPRTPGASVFKDPSLSMASARDRIVVGKSSRQDLLDILGPAEVIAFDSGYAVWVYREAAPTGRATRSATERSQLVVLLAPSGLVEKVRFRPASGAGA
jgi:hypothetical protein